MRLTLRTLLAWTDGLLPPEEARELAAKVESSVAARHLAERIRAAVARGPLPAVESDPNTVAEYLDNCLAADQLVPFERSCLESDAQLAEVAGCHELLAEFIRGGAGEPRSAPAERAAFTQPPRPRSAADAAAEPWAPRPTMPADHPSRPVATRAAARTSATTAWLSLLAAVVLLSALGGVLAWSLIRVPDGRKAAGPTEVAVAKVAPEPALAGRATAVPPPAVSPPAVPQPPVPEPPAAAREVPPAPVQSAPAQSVPVQPTRPAPAPSPPTIPVQAPAEPRVPFGDALAIVAPPGGVPPAPPPGPQPADVPPAGAVPVAPDPDLVDGDPFDRGEPRVTGGPAMLCRVDGDGGATWEAVTVGQPLTLPANLIAPACGRPAITADGLRLDVSPATQLTLTRDADDTLRLAVGFGAVVVNAARAEARLGVTAGELCGVASLEGAGGLGIEVTLGRESGADPELVAAERAARVMAVAGPFRWRQTAADGAATDQPLAGIAPQQVIPARAALAWTSTDPAAAAIAPPGSPPAWIAGASDRLDRSAAEALATRLAVGDPVAVALRDLVAAGRMETRTAAAATLALMGDYDEAVRLLCGDLPGDALREEQWRALEAAVVPLALARGPRAAAALAEAFAAHAPPGGGVDLFRLARGLGDADLANGGAAELVAALEAPQLVVRRYALKNLVEITGATGVDRIRYRPDRPESLRREGVAWWQAQLAQDRIRRAVDPAPTPRP